MVPKRKKKKSKKRIQEKVVKKLEKFSSVRGSTAVTCLKGSGEPKRKKT